MRTRRLGGAGMTTIFGFMKDDLTLVTNRRSENSLASFPAYAMINYK